MKKKNHYLLILLLFAMLISSCNTRQNVTAENVPEEVTGKISITDFSDDYYAILDMDNTEGAFKYGYEEFPPVATLTVYTINKKEMFSTPIYDIGYDLEEKFPSNIQQLPYGDQSLIIYDDFNFDGIKDLAIRDGYFSCYSGPSYNIYLADKQGFTFHPGFTELAQNFCGMFNVDKETKQIYTMTKSGCCWHQFSTYEIINNSPELIEEIIQDLSMFFERMTVTTYTKGKSKTEEILTLQPGYQTEFPETNLIFSFNTLDTDKKVLLFSYDQNIYYAYINQKDDYRVELIYPSISGYPDEKEYFEYRIGEDGAHLKFKNAWAEYTIYEADKAIGINVFTQGKYYYIKGDKSTQQGTLYMYEHGDFNNLTDWVF